MTATVTGSTATGRRPLDAVDPAASDAPSTDVRAPVGPANGPRHRWTLATTLAWLGVLVPFAIMTWVALVSTPTFDGGMNLQVAQNVADGTGYARWYQQLTFYPPEIQTSGVYIYLAAGLIKIFGSSTFIFQVPNLLFIGVLLIAVSLALRPWPVLRVLGPTVVLFAVPGLTENGMNGYGEYIIAALVISAMMLISTAVSSSRPVWPAVAALALIAIALTIKVVAALAVPVIVIGVLGVALVRRDIRWWKWVLALAGLIVPLGLNELYRLLSIGSLASYRQFWQNQLGEIAGQAGVSAAPTPTAVPKVGLLRTIADHLHLLSQATHVSAELLGLMIVLPYLVLIGLFLARGVGWREWVGRRGALLAVQAATYAGGYLMWWLAITPTEKAWLRRVVIGLLALAVLYLVLIGMVGDHLRQRSASTAHRARGAVLWSVAGVSAFVVALSGLATARAQVVAAVGSDTQREHQIEALADRAHSLAAQGNHLYGNGWWSAPVVALYGDLDLGNLAVTEVCSPEADFASGHNYLIWDFYALNLASTAPQSRFYDFNQIPGSDTGYGGIWQINLKPGVKCPTA